MPFTGAKPAHMDSLPPPALPTDRSISLEKLKSALSGPEWTARSGSRRPDEAAVDAASIAGAAGAGDAAPRAELLVVTDVGGTNTRVTVMRADRASDAAVTLHFVIKSARVLLATLHAVGDAIAAAGGRVAAGGLSVTGPVVGGVVNGIANYGALPEGQDDRWSLAEHQVLRAEELPPNLFPPKRSRLLNDLTSTCHGLLSLHDEDRVGSVFGALWDGGAATEVRPTPADALAPITLEATRNWVVINVGTGLGNAVLLSSAVTSDFGDGGDGCSPPSGMATPKLRVLSTEFGHSNVARIDGEHEFMSAYERDLGRIVEWDDLCSGRGLERCYAWELRHAHEASESKRDAAFVATSWHDEAAAKKAMLRFYGFVLRFAQCMCCAFQPKGVLLCGDNQVANDDFVVAHAAELREIFVDHGMERLGWLSSVCVLRQCRPFAVNQEGVARVLRKLV